MGPMYLVWRPPATPADAALHQSHRAGQRVQLRAQLLPDHPRHPPTAHDHPQEEAALDLLRARRRRQHAVPVGGALVPAFELLELPLYPEAGIDRKTVKPTLAGSAEVDGDL